MNLISITRDHFDWLLTIGRNVTYTTPKHFNIAVISFLFSHLFLLISVFLPFKVLLILTGSETDQILDWLGAENKNNLAVAISAIAIGSYGLHLFTNRLLNRAVESGAKQIAKFNRKLFIFRNQPDVIREAYKRLCLVAGSVCVSIAILIFGFFANPLVLTSMVLIILAEYYILYLLLKSDGDLGAYLVESFKNNLSVSCSVLGAVTFLLGFIVLVSQFITIRQHSVIVAILSVLLMRELTQRIRASIMDIHYLSNRRHQLDVLYNHAVPYSRIELQDAFKFMLTGSRDQWLTSALASILKQPVDNVSSKWLDLTTRGLACFEANASVSGSCERGRYLIKCYDADRHLNSEHEAQLFKAMGKDIAVAPRYVGDSSVDGTHVLVFEGIPDQDPDEKTWREVGLSALFDLWATNVETDLLDAYLRTHPVISKRLTPESVDHLRLASDGQHDKDILQDLQKLWPIILEEVESVPLVIVNPDFRRAFCRFDDHNRICCLSWSKWSIEPAGFSDVLFQTSRACLDAMVTRTRLRHPCLDITTDRLVLVSGLYCLEAQLARNNLRSALSLAGKIVQEVRSHQSRFK